MQPVQRIFAAAEQALAGLLDDARHLEPGAQAAHEHRCADAEHAAGDRHRVRVLRSDRGGPDRVV